MTQDRRTAIVTGAAQGVGAAIAERLARDGVARFALIDRNAAGLEALAKRLRDGGAEARTLVVDLADVDELIRRVGALAEELRSVDILINAAGVTDRGGLLDTSPAAYDRIFAINARAPFFMMQTIAPRMTKRGGVIVNIASMLAHGGPPFLIAYSGSKAALVTLTKNAANTLKRERIRVFALNLGWTVTPNEHRIQTEFHRLPENWVEEIGAKQPFGRLLNAEDIAGVAAFLCSNDASMMTGAIIDLDQFIIGTVDTNPGATL
jgi:NAD(P)-dependent dehydrogenase (short-subunit alcohol dehydrogenase family)